MSEVRDTAVCTFDDECFRLQTDIAHKKYIQQIINVDGTAENESDAKKYCFMIYSRAITMMYQLPSKLQPRPHVSALFIGVMAINIAWSKSTAIDFSRPRYPKGVPSDRSKASRCCLLITTIIIIIIKQIYALLEHTMITQIFDDFRFFFTLNKFD